MIDVHACSYSHAVIVPSYSFYSRDLRLFRARKCIKFTRNPAPFPIRRSSNNSRSTIVTFSLFRKQDSTSTARADGEDSSEVVDDDFATMILRENPCQIESKYLTNDCRLLTAKEKEKSSNNRGFLRVVSKAMNDICFKVPLFWWNICRRNEFSNKEPEYLNAILRWSTYRRRKESGLKQTHPVYLNDILREYKGKLYVPEQVFSVSFSEEDDFNRNLEELPKMSFLDFRKHMKYDKIKLLISKGVGDGVGKDFVVDLEEIPGEKSMHRTKWAMRLDEKEACSLIAEYKGPRHEIEKHYMCSVGKLLVYPNSVTISIFTRVLAELGMITSIMIAAVFLIIKAFALPMLGIGRVVFLLTVNMLSPMAGKICNFYTGPVVDFFQNVLEFAIDLFSEGGFFSYFFQVFASGGVSDSIEILKPILFVSVTMVLLIRFTLSRRPKNFKLWDIWQALDFAKSKAEARVDGSTGVKFNDVAGIDEAVEELQELVRYLKNPKLFDEMGIKPPHGVLLEGPPGCGKTLVAKAIAGEAGVPFYQMAGSEFVEVLVGVGSARIRDLFKRAKVNNPSVIFVDEIDAMATKRQEVFDSTEDHIYNAATQERETTLNQLLIELDGFDTGKGVIFLAATNRMDLLDPALLRPGRFDRKIRIRLPNVEGRLGILKIHAKKVKMSETVDLSTYAKNLPGWTGAMLAQLVQESALIALRNGKKSILPSHINSAVDRLTVGPVRLGLELGHQGQCCRATAEVGVALTSHLLIRLENAKVERCDRVSVTPRGETLSQLVFHRLDDESYKFERRPQLLHRLQVFLGGRAAEEVIYGHDLSLASLGYLADASWLARKILTVWNMDNPMVIHGEGPPWKKEFKFVGPRLDFEGELYDDYGLVEPPLGMNMEDEVAWRTDKLIKEMYGKTRSLLRKHHVALLKTIKVLLHQKEISGEDIDFILDRYPPEMPASSLFEEENPGILRVFEKDSSNKLESHII